MRLASRSIIAVIVAALGGLALICGLAGASYYQWSLAARIPGSKAHVRVVVPAGATADDIAQLLAAKRLIRNSWSFRLYAELSGTKAKLKAGGYALSAGQAVPDIVAHLVSGKSDELNVTILPGLNLREIQDSLIEDGFSRSDVEAAFARSYTHPVLADRPVGQGLEGYLYPDTYRLLITASASDVIEKSLDQLQAVLEQNGLKTAFAARGFTIHQGVTLASIIQKEVSIPADQRQVAQVFERRLSINMVLGSDVTFMYAAKQMGVAPSIDLDSPYNTRRYGGLPPGPIASPGLSALRAVAEPADGDYLYFVAGDDGTTHYGRTFSEHEANIAAYCHQLCQ